MSRISISTGGRIRQGLLIVAAIASVLTMVRCSGGDDNGGTSTAPPPGGGGGGATQFAYAIGAASSEIEAYRLDGDGNLNFVSRVATGLVPHHVNVDPTGKFVYVSNHESTFVSGFRINPDASLTPMNPAEIGSPVTGPDPSENQPHSSVMDQTRQYLYVVAGLGASTLRAYSIDPTAGTLTFIAGQSFPVGIHAHNITISPNNQFLYVAAESPAGEVHAFRRDTTTGALTPAGTPITGLPDAAAVTVDSQNRFLYVAYTNAVEVLQIAADGSLTRITPTSAFPTGNGPHSFAMHPNGQFLYVANINPPFTINVFRVDSTTGALTEIQVPPLSTGQDPNYVIVHPNGKFLYTADAVSDQVSRFTINADGTLTSAGTTPTGNGTNGIGITKF